jgi:hypothetical protein
VFIRVHPWLNVLSLLIRVHLCVSVAKAVAAVVDLRLSAFIRG